MRNLENFRFTDSSDSAISLSGWELISGATAGARSGNDRIIGVNGTFSNGVVFGIDLDRDSTLRTGSGDDVIFGLVTRGSSYRALINSGEIRTGNGDDIVVGASISSQGSTGFFNSGLINGGVIDTSGSNGKSDDDIVAGIAWTGQIGLLNDGSIVTGDGSDVIIGISGRVGIQQDTVLVTEDVTIDTGAGDDIIYGKGDRIGIDNQKGGGGLERDAIGIITTGPGNDSITGIGSPKGRGSIGIVNDGIIATGAGDDSIMGEGKRGGIYNTGSITTGKGDDSITGIGSEAGIFNSASGTIGTGKGNDTVNALESGFAGEGSIRLGDGDDNLMGFGSGKFFGGQGTDTLTFNTGTYTITYQGNGFYLIGGVMRVKGFEAFGDGASETDFFAAADDGFVTFA